MLVSSAKVVEMSFISDVSFEEAVRLGLEILKRFDVDQAWVKDQRAFVHHGSTRYQVNIVVTSVVDTNLDGWHI